MLPAGSVVTVFVGGGELLVLVVRLLPLFVFVLLLVFAGWALDEWVDDDERPVWLDLNNILQFQELWLHNYCLIITSLYQAKMISLQFDQLPQITALIVVETYCLINFANHHLYK